MALNENVVKGKWLEIKGDIQKAWGKLTDNELEKTKGDMKAISGLIRQRYGMKEVEYERKLNDIFKKFENQKDKFADDVKKSLRN